MAHYRSSSNDPFVGLAMLLITLAVIAIVLTVKLVARTLGAYVGLYVRHGRPGAPLARALWLPLLGSVVVVGACALLASAEPRTANSFGVVVGATALVYVISTLVVARVAHYRSGRPEHVDRYARFQ